MFGQMMDRPLLISSVLRHAETQHPNREIVSVTADQPRHRYTYREAFSRARKLANALARLGAKRGDRIGTLAWNDYRHFEIYYGVSGSGFVCHTLNPRLFEDQIIYIANHAEDRWLFLDPVFVPQNANAKDFCALPPPASGDRLPARRKLLADLEQASGAIRSTGPLDQ